MAFTSNPSGAVVSYEDRVLGTTPFTVNIAEKPPYNGPSTISGSVVGTKAGIREAFARIERQRRMANYVFVAKKEGFNDSQVEFPVNNGMPIMVRFELKPTKTPAGK